MATRTSNKGGRRAPAKTPAISADAAAIVGEQGASENAATVEAAPAETAAPETTPEATPAAAPAEVPPPAKPAKVPAVVQHGVQRPRAGGKCAAVWELTEQMAEGEGDTHTLPSIEKVKTAATAQGLNPTNVSIEYYRCRQFHGVRGRQQKPAPAATPEATAQQ